MELAIYEGEALGAYGYEEKEWFRPHIRLAAFLDEVNKRGLREKADMRAARAATDDELLTFHTREHVGRMLTLCAKGEGALDHGPTLARPHIEPAARHVVGTVLDATRAIVDGDVKRAFVPIAGFHHGRRGAAKDYCLYNDCCIALQALLASGHSKVAYIDVDVHHGDGVAEGFAADERVCVVDLHEDRGTLWPHSPEEPATLEPQPCDASNLNLAMKAGDGDQAYGQAFDRVEAFVDQHAPSFIVFESGVDCLAGDAMGHMTVTPEGIASLTRRVRELADRHAGGRLLTLGGGGYHLPNVREGWTAVVEALI